MFKKLAKLFGNGSVEPSEPAKVPKKRSPKKVVLPKTPKELATEAGEPYIAILEVDVDPDNINSGSFVLDWNDKFVLNLYKAGYKHKPEDTDQVMVDRWFQNICRNIALEVYEQNQADPTNRPREEYRPINSRDIGDGRSEIS